MAQGRIFVNPADHITNYPYDVKVPAYVFPQPDVFMSGEMEPFKVPANADATSRTRMSIHRLLQLFDVKTPFIIVRDIDVIEIFHAIDVYLVSLELRLRANEPAAVAYARRLLALRAVWYRRLFLKVLKRHPDWKLAYLGQQNEITDVFALFPSIPGLGKLENLDPIRNLATPPVQIAPLVEPTAAKPAPTPLGDNSTFQQPGRDTSGFANYSYGL